MCHKFNLVLQDMTVCVSKVLLYSLSNQDFMYSFSNQGLTEQFEQSRFYVQFE